MVRNQRRNQNRNKPPEWFQNIPKDSPKWICTLHKSLTSVEENTVYPSNPPHCCPHVYRRITQFENNSFIVWKQHNHEFIKCFDVEIAHLLGTEIDPNQFQLASGSVQESELFTVEKLHHYRIVQPISTAIQLAHKLGLEGSFNRYDEIILSLAKQVGDKITTEHEKTFDWYEKLRNLALNNPEPTERFLAMERAYERGKKLIGQFMELMKPPPEEEDEIQNCIKCAAPGNQVSLHRSKITPEIFLCSACLQSVPRFIF